MNERFLEEAIRFAVWLEKRPDIKIKMNTDTDMPWQRHISFFVAHEQQLKESGNSVCILNESVDSYRIPV